MYVVQRVVTDGDKPQIKKQDRFSHLRLCLIKFSNTQHYDFFPETSRFHMKQALQGTPSTKKEN